MGDFFAEICYSNSVLLHRVAFSDGNSIVLHCLIVNSDTIGGTYGILATITLPDGVFFVVLTSKVEAKLTHYFACLFVQTIFAYEREYSEFDRRQGSGEA